MVKVDQLVSQLENITIWKRGHERAPHKPLLLLLTLAEVQRGGRRLLPFVEVEDKLRSLLADFGPSRKAHHPEYPFWRLQNDEGIWEIPQREQAVERRGELMSSGDVPATVLREIDAHGGFTEPLYRHLSESPQVVNELAARLLDAHFPPSLHEDLLDAVGMPWVQDAKPGARDPDFRARIIRIYNHRCAVCGFNGRLGFSDLGLDAAHVMWHSHGGPCLDDNGVALCSLHHRMLDRGAISMDSDRRVLVSQEVNGGTRVDEFVIRYAGQEMARPQPGSKPVAERYIAWHRREVFREPPRGE